MRFLGVILAPLILAAGPASAGDVAPSAAVLSAGDQIACNCPKEQQVKKYGRIVGIRPAWPLPPAPPPWKSGSPSTSG